jgi:hypothetical protein
MNRFSIHSGGGNNAGFDFATERKHDAQHRRLVQRYQRDEHMARLDIIIENDERDDDENL